MKEEGGCRKGVGGRMGEENNDEKNHDKKT